MLLVPHRPGILALAEEIVDAAGGKRMLALFHVAEARDLSLAVSALFASGSGLRNRLSEGRCFVRYAMISDPEDRRAVCQALEAWMQATAEQATGVVDCDPGDCAAPQGLKPLVFAAVDGRVAAQVGAEAPTYQCVPLRKTRLENASLGKRVRPVFPAGF